MLRRSLLWLLGFACSLVLIVVAAASCAAEDAPSARDAEGRSGQFAAEEAGAGQSPPVVDLPRLVDLENRLAFGWALLHANSLYADRLPDWDTCRAQYGSGLSRVDEAAADEAMNKLLSLVRDDYTFFRNRVQTARFRSELEQRGVVRYSVDADGVAWIRIRTFASKHTANELRDALRDVSSTARRYVVDLRGNHGGLVNEAFTAYSLFVDEGVFATFRGRNCGEDYSETLSVSRTRLCRQFNDKVRRSKRYANMTAHKPVFVLIDNDTRSAAELLAGALHDTGRATLVGTRTYGKGVVQDTWNLGDGSSVRITTARAYLAKSGCIHGIGLRPDAMTIADLHVVSLGW